MTYLRDGARDKEAAWAVVTQTRSGLMRFLASKHLLALAAALVPGLAQAQFGNIGSYSPPSTNPYPVYSPYLNLNRPGNVAQNYFGLVQPQLQAQRNFQQINQ